MVGDERDDAVDEIQDNRWPGDDLIWTWFGLVDLEERQKQIRSAKVSGDSQVDGEGHGKGSAVLREGHPFVVNEVVRGRLKLRQVR